jgi:DNA-directed RNA polymerase specialized sigma24 family protein
MVMSAVSRPMKARLADPALRREVEVAVRRRIHGDDAEDVVQATFADLLSAPQLPDDAEEFRRFVFGVARNKVFDHFRRQKRELAEPGADPPSNAEPPLSARDILRWAEGKLPDSEAQDTRHQVSWTSALWATSSRRASRNACQKPCAGSKPTNLAPDAQPCRVDRVFSTGTLAESERIYRKSGSLEGPEGARIFGVSKRAVSGGSVQESGWRLRVAARVELWVSRSTKAWTGCFG